MISQHSGDHASRLAPCQEEIWRRSLRAGRHAALYNETITIERRGSLDVAVLERCLAEIIHRHEAWRTTFPVIDGLARQVVHSAPPRVSMSVHDLTRLPPSGQHAEFLRSISLEARVPFDLSNGPLLKATLFKTADQAFRLSLVVHQSIVDGVSAYQILPTEIAALYHAFSQNEPSPLPALPIQYRHFAARQNGLFEEGHFSRQLDFWHDQLAGPLPEARWPRNSSLARKETFHGRTFSFIAPSGLGDRIAKFSRTARVTPFTTLLAGFVTVLYGYTTQSDLIIATLSPCGRKSSETQRLLGYFLNPVALRFDLSGNPSFSDLLVQARRVLADAISNDDLPMEFLEKELHLNSGRDPFVKVAISMQPRAASLGRKWTVTTMDAQGTGSPWDFYLAFIEREDTLIGRAQYNPDSVAEADVAQALGDLWQVLKAAVLNPNARVEELSSR